MGKRGTTILDVASAAGVSTATVSRVLNGGPVSPSAQAAVEQAVERLNYRRNDLARGLVTGKTGVVGLLIPDIIGPLYAQMARGIEDVLEPLGMHYMMVTDNRRLSQEIAALELLLARQVDALVLVGSRLGSKKLKSILSGGPTTVLVQPEWRAGDDEFTTLRLDNRAGVIAAVEHLVEQGHTGIAHVAGVRRDGAERRQFFEEEMRRCGLEPAMVLESDSREEGGLAAGNELLTLIRGRRDVTAVFCSNDRVAVGLYHAARLAGKRVPDDLSVVGFDDLPWSAYLDPPLTTVRQPARAMGLTAAEQVVAALGGNDVVKQITVATELTIRASTIDLRVLSGR